MDFPQSSLVVAEAEAGARAAVRRWRELPEYTAMPLAPEQLAQLTAALLAPRPRISQVYLYDAAGCELYEWITRLEHEYYLTAKETELLEEHAADIAQPLAHLEPPREPAAEPAAEAAASADAEAASDGAWAAPSNGRVVVVELGAGTGRKTLLLLAALLRHATHRMKDAVEPLGAHRVGDRAGDGIDHGMDHGMDDGMDDGIGDGVGDSLITYAPIDVSAESLEINARACAPLLGYVGGGVGGGGVGGGGGVDSRAARLTRRLTHRPLLGDFGARLPETREWMGSHLYLYLGSSLGNFDDEEGLSLFRQVRACMRPRRGDRFIVGVDAPHSETKPVCAIERAYNDGCGVTAAFTLNALRHLNAIAGTDFDWREGWRHVAEYSRESESIVTHVQAVGAQRVRSRDGQILRVFAPGERIFMEQSRKFSLEAMQRLAAGAGLELARHWTNRDKYHLIVELVLPGMV